MTFKRILAITLIFFIGATGWFVLGQVNWVRSHDTSSMLSASVQSLWGAPIVQHAPQLTVKVPGTKRKRHIFPSKNQIRADIKLEQRRKGLVWYPTYTVDFTAVYKVTNEARIAQDIRLNFQLPSKQATYENVELKIGSKTESFSASTGYGFQRIIPLSPQGSEIVEIHYQTRGVGSWLYKLDTGSGRVSGLDVVVTTNFDAVDFIEASLSPMQTETTATGLAIHWQANELITSQDIGIELPQKLNPGPLAARMSFFAPVCLLFFFVLITAICITRNIDIHPMHYLFVNAGFFAFHLLFAYTIDLINVHVAFVIASVVSVSIVVRYLSSALGEAFPWKIAAVGQFVYLVLFSYSFFITGMTGLTVTIVSILTLAVLMQITSKTNWGRVFAPGSLVKGSA
ncbi:MAG: hypothetical protein GY784_13155 [Gammaproteobacteria bacterium]|nr:hypothetical protein [Gammaproteobacteria bacterium]